jgi:hypothetical protein
MVSMNTTLQEHIKQAIFAVEEEGIILPLVLEKFAQLIIAECLNQCYYRGMNDELYAGQLRAALYIEQHFGAEP